MIKTLSKNIYHFLIGLMLLFLLCFIWKIGFGIPSSYTDSSYHLAAAEGFIRAGGIVIWDFWESLPLGRPHNYPPLFHLVLASLLKFGLSPSVAIKLMMELTVVGSLSIYAWGLSKLFNIKVAFWAMVMLFFSVHFVQLSATVMPATIVTFLVPLLLYFVLNKKWLSYSALLTMMFYLHLFMPYFIVLSLIIYLIIFRKKLLKSFCIASFTSFLLYLPWLIHVVLGGWEYIKYFDSNTGPDMWKKFVLINLFVVILTIAGICVLFKNRKDLPDQYFFFLIMAIIILSPSFMIASRLFDSHFLVFAVILSTLAISWFLQSRLKYFLIILVVIYCWFTPTLKVGDVTKIVFSPSIINNSNNLYDQLGKDPEKKFSPLIGAIKQKAREGETITTLLTNIDNVPIDKNYRLSISNTLASYTKLSTQNLRQPEIYYRPFPDITKSSFLLTNASINGLDAAYFESLGYDNAQDTADFVKNNFQYISSIPFNYETVVYCYYNISNNVYKEKIPHFKFPLFLGDGILLIFIGMIIYDNKKIKKIDTKNQ